MHEDVPDYIKGHDVELWRKRPPHIRRIIEMKHKHKEQLERLPNVVGLGVGLVRVGGETTEEAGLRVYVRCKLSLDEMPEPDQTAMRAGT